MANLILAVNTYEYSYSKRTKSGNLDYWIASNVIPQGDSVYSAEKFVGLSGMFPPNIVLVPTHPEKNLQCHLNHCEVTDIHLWDTQEMKPCTFYLTAKEEPELSNLERIEIKEWLGKASVN